MGNQQSIRLLTKQQTRGINEATGGNMPLVVPSSSLNAIAPEPPGANFF